jgi:hypothetical protein
MTNFGLRTISTFCRLYGWQVFAPAGCPRSRFVIQRASEINQRRSRRKKLAKLKRKLEKATVSEKKEIVHKLRALTPGAEVIIANWGLDDRKT